MTETITDTPQPLTSHLEELRSRLIISLLFIAAFSVAGYFLSDPFINWLARPVGEFIFTSPTEALFLKFKIAGGFGVIAAFPIIVYETWRFIERALSIRIRSLIFLIVPFSCVLFYAGASLALFGVAPAAIKFLLRFGSPTLKPLISLSEYLSFIIWMMVGFGVFFELPVVIVVLAHLGVVTAETLGEYRRHAFVGIFLAAAFLTPGPDVFSQILLGVPAYLLFEISILLARRFQKK